MPVTPQLAGPASNPNATTMKKNLSKSRRHGRKNNPNWNAKASGWQGAGARKLRGLAPREGRS